MADNTPSKNAPKAVPGSKATAVSLANPDAIQATKTADKNPVPPVLAAEQPTPQSALRRRALRLSTRIFFGVFGVAGGIGKSLTADGIADLYRMAKRSVEVIRLETEMRRREFSRDSFISLEAVTKAHDETGGAAALFDDALDLTERTFAQDGVVILDGGANSHGPVANVLAETGLPQLVADLHGRTIFMILVTRDADLIRQTVDLIAELCDCAPEAEIIIVLNERNGKFVNDTTPEGRAYGELLAPLLRRHRHVVMPFAAARALAAFARCGRSFSEIFQATDPELMEWSGLRRMAARSCQTHLGAYYNAYAAQLLQVLPFRQEG